MWCSDTPCDCATVLCICTNCVEFLKRNRLPKYAVAKSNFVSQLPASLCNMSAGTRCLIHPAHAYGCLTTYASIQLTGHMYFTKLTTTLVRNKIPWNPANVCMRALVVGPFTNDEQAAWQAKVALAKTDYVIQPATIREHYNIGHSSKTQ